ncbi:MAG: RelA/SpoT family protein [Prevotellaceae bacterium]|jgi:GTP pyrophosphokinase|nr:RelA/SpoT family protein [Prevotellaceae bacterium]
MKTERQIREKQDELLINKAFEDLLEDYKKSNHRQKCDIIRKAFNFANSAHKGVRRRSGEPYIMHPIAVAKIVVNEIGLGSTSICAALLHDVVEDTDYTVEDLGEIFGKKIAQIVDGLTKISGGVFGTRDSVQAENFRHLLLTMSEDIRVVLIKIADRLHNMRTLSSMLPAKQYKIAGETMYIYAPLALRLGLFRIKTELENLSFKYEHPEIYQQLSERLKETHCERTVFAEEFQQKIENKLHELGYEFTMKGRVKSPYSVWHKMQKENIPFEEVYDKLAFRIVFKPKEGMSEKDQCWMLYSAITTIYKPHPERIRDWVSTPKANGYEALHVTVMGPHGKWVEVQIRSERMHEIAERGLAAHWKYKGGDGDSESELDKWLKTIKELLENHDPSAIDFIDTIKLDLFASEIFVFTPKGEIKTIAQGASALDFAFAIHSDLGKRCIGAKANHKLVPLSYKLQSGDQVEILTSKKQSPQREWLNFVTTARAKQKLQTFFRQEDKALIVAGQKKLEETLKTLNISNDNQNIQKILTYFNLSSRDELFLEIGKALLNLDELKKVVFKTVSKNIFSRYLINPFLISNKNKSENVKDQPTTINQPFKIDMKRALMLTEETAGKLYKLAPCCHPIPGDEVLGYVDEETGVTIHKRACPVADKLKSNFGNRIVSAQWATHKLYSYLEQIEIKGIDKKGVIIEILQVISINYGFNVGKINVESTDGIFLGKVFVYVHDTNEINELCRQLEKNSHITSVRRIQEIAEV